MGLPSLGADGGQRTSSSLSLPVSWKACPLLPPGESQVYRRNSIRGQGKGLLCVCVCVGCVYVWCVVYMWCVHVCRILRMCACYCL